MARYLINRSEKSRRRRVIFWGTLSLIILAIIIFGALWFIHHLKPQTQIKQAKAVTSTINYSPKTKQYSEPDFTIALPNSWHVVDRPPGPYQTYTWQSSDVGSNGQVITVFEDTIPPDYAVNRVLIVSGQVDHLTLDGVASDNCANYTTSNAVVQVGKPGVMAKWQGVSFICDNANTQRDIIGTSSTDGLDFVLLRNQSTGKTHKFLFSYTDYSINPDYNVFYDTLNSLRMN